MADRQFNRSVPAPRRLRIEAGDVLRAGAAALLLLLAIAAAAFGLAPPWLPVAYLMLGAVSALVYTVDKRAAVAGRWRITEGSMHFIDLIGGIAGGLLAQLLLRHKTRKPGFITTTALIGLAHLAGLGALLGGLWQIPPLLFL